MVSDSVYPDYRGGSIVNLMSLQRSGQRTDTCFPSCAKPRRIANKPQLTAYSPAGVAVPAGRKRTVQRMPAGSA
jgi:hypothetical protein